MSTVVASTIDTVGLPSLSSQFDSSVDVGGSGFKAADLIDLLQRSCSEFEEVRQGAEVAELNVTNCGKGNGYLSLVLKIEITFEPPRSEFSCVLKIPMPDAMSSMVDDEAAEIVGKDIEGKAEVVDENSRMIIDGHNLECEFYDRFLSLGSFPMPKIYAKRPFACGPADKQIGFLLMENLANGNEVLGLHRTATVEQCRVVARAIAHFQFHAQRQPEHREMWMNQEQNLHLDTFYNSWMPAGLGFASTIKSLRPLIDRVRPLFHRGFGRYSIRQRARQYDAVTICHGDIQPFNVFFGVNPDSPSELTDRIGSIIDFQMITYGNSAFDLARFVVCSVDGDVRKEADEESFRSYYDELQRLHDEAGDRIRFTFEQGLELFHLALCQQSTFIAVFLFFIDAMIKQSGSSLLKMPRMIERTEYSLKRTIEFMDKYGLHDFDGDLALMAN